MHMYVHSRPGFDYFEPPENEKHQRQAFFKTRLRFFRIVLISSVFLHIALLLYTDYTCVTDYNLACRPE